MRTIEPSDLSYQRFALKQFNDAQAVLQAWKQYLATKYQLVATDVVTEQGEIISQKRDVSDAQSRESLRMVAPQRERDSAEAAEPNAATAG